MKTRTVVNPTPESVIAITTHNEPVVSIIIVTRTVQTITVTKAPIAYGSHLQSFSVSDIRRPLPPVIRLALRCALETI